MCIIYGMYLIYYLNKKIVNDLQLIYINIFKRGLFYLNLNNSGLPFNTKLVYVYVML